MDGRSFLAEDAPENKAEEAVFRYWMAEFLQDIELYRENTADQAAIEGVQEEYVQKKHQLREFSLHVLKTVSEEKREEAERAFRCSLEEASQKYGLTQSLLVQAEWTEERQEPVNYGNGSHNRYYLCGRTQEETAWRIYEFGMM